MRRWIWSCAALLAVLTVACAPDAEVTTTARGESASAASTTSTTTTTVAPEPTTTTQPPPPVRSVAQPAGAPFATTTTSGLTLVHPADAVERVAFHESNHDGAQPMAFAATATNATVLESRERDTPAQTAADIVVAPDGVVRAPVTGTIKRGGGYTLYCKYSDNFLVIRPDAAPHLEVKVLHISGLAVRRGEHVNAGETVIAAHPTPLPFASQVDDLATAPPAWPHVHVEVVDPSVKDRPTPGGGCS